MVKDSKKNLVPLRFSIFLSGAPIGEIVWIRTYLAVAWGAWIFQICTWPPTHSHCVQVTFVTLCDIVWHCFPLCIILWHCLTLWHCFPLRNTVWYCFTLFYIVWHCDIVSHCVQVTLFDVFVTLLSEYLTNHFNNNSAFPFSKAVGVGPVQHSPDWFLDQTRRPQ